MKSRKEHFESRRLLMVTACILYGVAALLFLLALFIHSGFSTIAIIISLVLLGGMMCSLYAHRSKEFLFCPKCGSKHIVKTGLFGIPTSITDTCPDCGKKVNIDKGTNQD